MRRATTDQKVLRARRLMLTAARTLCIQVMHMPLRTLTTTQGFMASTDGGLVLASTADSIADSSGVDLWGTADSTGSFRGRRCRFEGCVRTRALPEVRKNESVQPILVARFYLSDMFQA